MLTGFTLKFDSYEFTVTIKYSVIKFFEKKVFFDIFRLFIQKIVNQE